MILFELIGLVVGSILTRALVECLDRHFTRASRKAAERPKRV